MAHDKGVNITAAQGVELCGENRVSLRHEAGQSSGVNDRLGKVMTTWT